MVAGKVRAAMGFHKSPSHDRSTKPSSAPPPPPPPPPTPPALPSPRSTSSSSSTSASKSHSKNNNNNNNNNNNKSKQSTVLSRSFGLYFPRSSSAQVQPRPPDVAELLRLVEELRDREARLKTEVLELKILKETASIVPVLESAINSKNDQLDRAGERIDILEMENTTLKEEARAMRAEVEKTRAEATLKMQEMEREIAELKKNVAHKDTENEELKELSSSYSQRFHALNDLSSKSNIVKCLKRVRCTDAVNSNNNNNYAGCVDVSKTTTSFSESSSESEKPSLSRSNSEDYLASDSVLRSRVPRVPKPPPKPSCSSLAPPLTTTVSDQSSLAPPPPPPPPPLPVKGLRAGPAKVRRVPEVVEFYHSLMRRESRKESISGTGGGGGGVNGGAVESRDMIGEIENRSAHLLAIKTDVETQGDFIKFLIKQVQTAVFSDIGDVVPFIKWLDDELSYLVDERAVLKHFEWPEQKADALREAAFGYGDLKKLESEASSFRDNPRQPCGPALKKIQALFEKLEHGVYNLSRMRESATIRFKGFQIPTDWMLETGIVSQIKLASVKLAMKYMKRVSAELEIVGGGPEEEELIVQGVRFAFRVHQFAGGFDVETMRAFQELRDKARSCHAQCQNHHEQKIMCRSATC